MKRLITLFLLGTSLAVYSSEETKHVYEKAWTESVIVDAAGIMAALTAGGGVYWGSKKLLKGISTANRLATPLKWTPLIFGISITATFIVEGIAEDGIDYWYEQHLTNKIEKHFQTLESQHDDLIIKDVVGHIIKLAILQEINLLLDTINSFKAINNNVDDATLILEHIIHKYPQIISFYPKNYGFGMVQSYLIKLERLNVEETLLTPLRGYISFRRSLKKIILKTVPDNILTDVQQYNETYSNALE